MKKFLTLIGALACISVSAQTTPTNTLAWYQTIWSDITTSGIEDATNYSFEPYATYAPSAPHNRQWGGGMLAIYNVNNYLGAGIGADYLGQFTMVSGNIQLKVDTTPLAFLGGFATNIVVTPFALAGVGTPLGGSSSGPISITDVGGAVSFGHLWGGRFNTGLAWGQWSNAGLYSGTRYHLFAGWKYGF